MDCLTCITGCRRWTSLTIVGPLTRQGPPPRNRQPPSGDAPSSRDEEDQELITNFTTANKQRDEEQEETGIPFIRLCLPHKIPPFPAFLFPTLTMPFHCTLHHLGNAFERHERRLLSTRRYSSPMVAPQSHYGPITVNGEYNWRVQSRPTEPNVCRQLVRNCARVSNPESEQH